MKPGYVDPFALNGSDALSFRPPLLFRDVTVRSFPLKANIARLTQFCDQYLNMDIPDTIVRFTPALPYVYLMVLNYGGMSATSMEAQRLGWVAQHEVFFLVPLNRWRRENGKLVFKGWTSATPFIFVDDPMSMITGREVYGWPKVQAFIDADKPLWANHPRAPTRLFTMSTNVFADVYAGQEEPPRVLVTVDRDTVASYAEFPPDLKCPWSPTSLWPNVIRNSLSLMGEAIDIAAGLRSRGYPPGRDLRAIAAMTGQAVTMTENLLAGLLPPALAKLLGGRNAPQTPYGQAAGVRGPDVPPFFTSSLNLKQFRNPERPEFACYTALIDSAMGVDRVNQIGLLGDWDLLRGDPSGGYSVSIRHYDSQPILESLGIEVPAGREALRNGDVVTLRPTLPYWMDVDLYYGAGKVICSRTPFLNEESAAAVDRGGDDWVDEAEPSRPVTRGLADVKKQPPRVDAKPPAFNTALGAATEPVVGPFHFPDVTLQVYPLLADPERLAGFIDAFWNRLFADGTVKPSLRLEPLGSYVYMVVSVIGDHGGTMWSNANNLGWWAEREVAFCIPVKWRSHGDLISVAMIEPFVYANKAREVVTDREVNGRNSIQAEIESPPDIWMSSNGPAERRRLAQVRTESYEALGLGQEAKMQTLLAIDECDPLPADDIAGWRKVAEKWGSVLAEDAKRKAWLRGSPATREAIVGVQNLALEALAQSAPVNRLTLKQYRDAADPNRACYQAVVHTSREIADVHEIREIERPVHVSITRLANHPIVDTLGLRVKHVRSDANGVVDCLQPIRPFWMRIAVKERLGAIVATVDPFAPSPGRTEERVWKFKSPWFDRHSAKEAASKRHVGDVGKPYFVRQRSAAVGAKWNELLAQDDRVGLRGAIQVRSGRALKYELAWKRRQIALLPMGKRQALRQAMKGQAEYGWFESLLRAPGRASWPPGPNSFIALVSALTNEQMSSLAAAIDHAARTAGARLNSPADLILRPAASEPAGSQGEAPAPTSPGRDGDLLAWLERLERWITLEPAPPYEALPWEKTLPAQAVESLRNIIKKRRLAEGELDPTRRRLLAMTVDLGVWEALVALKTLFDPADAPSFPERQREYDDKLVHGEASGRLDPTAMLKIISDAFGIAVEDWVSPSRWRRFTRKEAAEAIENVGDLQLAFEAILRDRWERTSDPGEAIGPRLPYVHIPTSSIGPIGYDPNDHWASLHGMKRWPEPSLAGSQTLPIFVVSGAPIAPEDA